MLNIPQCETREIIALITIIALIKQEEFSLHTLKQTKSLLSSTV